MGIRKSTDADLGAIRAWLVDQDARNIPDSFLCNWELIQEGHKKGKLLVYIDDESNQSHFDLVVCSAQESWKFVMICEAEESVANWFVI
jgi:hypothetical protein